MKRSTRASNIGLSAVQSSVQGGKISTRFSIKAFVVRVEKLTTEQRNAIKRAGFGNLLLIPNQTINRKLLVELFDRWSSESRVFVFPHGEIGITLLDVALITGLHVTGNPVLLQEDEPFSDLELEFGATPEKRKVSVLSLESKLDSLGGTTDDDFVRTFLLFTFGTILFPSSSCNVDTRYLSFLRNVDDIRRYAWGEAVLEELLLWLNKRKDSNVLYFGGFLILLQIWSFEHFDIARPSLLDGMAFPRACRWESRKPPPRQSFTAMFQELNGDQIIWTLEPTSYELELEVVRETTETQGADEDADPLPIDDFSSPVPSGSPVLGSNCSLQVAESDIASEIDVADDTPGFEDISELQPREMQTELDLLSEVDCPIASPCKSELPTRVLELPSSPDTAMELPVTVVNEDALQFKYQILQERVEELEKDINDLRLENNEIDDIRVENGLLKEQMSSIRVENELLEEENHKLKEEVVSMKREYKNLISFNSQIVQIEKEIAEYGANNGKGT